jgi:hypothetical protein
MHRVEVVPWSIAATNRSVTGSLPSAGELAGDRPRGLHHPGGQAGAGVPAAVAHAGGAPAIATAPTTTPPWSRIGAAMLASRFVNSSTSEAQPRSRIVLN